jgi:hypothetical protein
MTHPVVQMWLVDLARCADGASRHRPDFSVTMCDGLAS